MQIWIYDVAIAVIGGLVLPSCLAGEIVHLRRRHAPARSTRGHGRARGGRPYQPRAARPSGLRT